MAVDDASDIFVLVRVLLPHLLQEILVLLHSLDLLVNAFLLLLKDHELLLFPRNLLSFTSIILSQLRDRFISLRDVPLVRIEVACEGDQGRLDFLVFLAELRFLLFEVVLFLSEVTLFLLVCLLVFVHGASFLEKTSRWRVSLIRLPLSGLGKLILRLNLDFQVFVLAGRWFCLHLFQIFI